MWLCQALPISHLVAAALAEKTSVVTVCHAENVTDARFALSVEGVTALAITLDVWRTLVCVFADDPKPNAGRNQFRESRSALKQHVWGRAAWLAHSKEVMKRKKRLIDR